MPATWPDHCSDLTRLNFSSGKTPAKMSYLETTFAASLFNSREAHTC